MYVCPRCGDCPLIILGRRSGAAPHIPAVELAVNNGLTKIDPAILPTSEQAVRENEQSGGHITDPDNACLDPLDEEKRSILETTFIANFPSMEQQIV